MDSASAPPEPGAFGRSLAHRMTPQVTVIRRAVVQPGFIARRSIAFGSYIGQSQVSRWSIGATMSRGAMAVRPPIDYWPWASAEEPEPVAVPRLDRSLPRAKLLRRSGQPDPGAIVKAMRPEPIDLATRGQAQAKAPKRNDMQSFKAMLERTGRIPASDGDGGDANAERRRGTAAVPPGRERAAIPARPSSPTRAAAPAAMPRATVPNGAASPRAVRTAPSPSPAVGTSPAARPGPTPPRPQRPNPFDHDDEPGPTLRRTAGDDATSPSPTLQRAAESFEPIESADRSLDLPVSPVWPGAIESPANTATPPTISARRAAEQLRSARGPRPLPAVISPSVEQVAPRKWSSTEAIDAGELAQQLIARRTPSSSASLDADPARGNVATTHQPNPIVGETAAHDAAAHVDAAARVDAATAPVAPAGVQRVELAADPHSPPVAQRSPERASPTNAASPTRTPAAVPAATRVAAASTVATPMPPQQERTTAPIAAAPDAATATESPSLTGTLAPTAVAAPATVAPPALLVQRSSPVGPSLLLPAGEAAAAPRTDGRDRARQLPAPATAAPPASPMTAEPAAGTATPNVARETTLSDRTKRMLARPLSPQPPDLSMPPATTAPSISAISAEDIGAVRPAAFIAPSTASTSPAATGQTSTTPTAATPTAATTAAATTPSSATADLMVRRTTTADRSAQTDDRVVVAHSPARAERPAPPARPTPDRFLQVLQASPAPAPKHLPARFIPLARSIAGDARVQLRHDEGARAALAAVGKRAATIGNTILLDAAPTSAAATTVLAHELTHVANPTMAPRFYDDERQTVEERRADAVAQLIQRSPSLLTAPVGTTPLGSTTQSLAAAANAAASAPAARSQGGMAGTAPATTVRRSLDTSLPPPPPQRATPLASSPPAVRPLAPIGSPAGRSSGGTSSAGSSRAATVRRSITDAASSGRAGGGAIVRRSTASTAGAASTETPTVRRAMTDSGNASGDNQPAAAAQDENALPPIIAAMTSTGGQLDFVDWIVEQVEDRVVAEFQRRGGRFREDF